MKLSHTCPKCKSNSIFKKKSPGRRVGEFIALSNFWVTEGNSAKITNYICGECGYIERYLDEKELEKVEEYLTKK